jgi:GntR family histidine utilization transcriptional repressor
MRKKATAVDGENAPGWNSQDASPRYQQVKTYVLSQVNSGTWTEGHRLPSESEFAAQLGMSRLTIHRAIRELSEDGVVVRTPGVGSFVARSKPLSTLLNVRSIVEEIRERGHRHSATVHILRSELAGEVLSTLFNLPFGSAIFHSVIVHRENDVAVQLEDRYVNPAFAPGYIDQDLANVSPHEFLANFGQPDEVEHVIEAVIPDSKKRRYLGMNSGEPCLLLHRRTWVGNLVATKAELYHPGSRYRLGGKFNPKSVIRR